jgi:hypothetical protein
MNRKSKGLGDTFARALSSLGVKPCGGCKRRQQTLNRMVPYNASLYDMIGFKNKK